MQFQKKLTDMNESELHKVFFDVMCRDFYTVHEARGVCFLNHPSLENSSVIADFLLYPRQHLLDAGFADSWFAVEIKKSRTHIAVALKQAFWYTVSSFEIKGRLITPAFALGWVPDWDPRTRKPEVRDWSAGLTIGEASAFGYLNVGTFDLLQDGYKDWNIRFYSGINYAYRRFNGELHINKQFKSFKLPVGNSSNISTHSGIEGMGGIL